MNQNIHLGGSRAHSNGSVALAMRVHSQDLGPKGGVQNNGSSGPKYAEVLQCSDLGQWDTAATGAPEGRSINNHSNSSIPKEWMHWGCFRQLHLLGSALVKDVGDLCSKGYKCLPGIFLLSFSPWGKIFLRLSPLAPRFSALDHGVTQGIGFLYFSMWQSCF